MSEVWQEVRRELLASGWQLAARGDWAWVYRSADGMRAARLCPYDPAHRLFVHACGRHPGNPYLPALLELRELGGGAQLVITPWYEPVTEQDAAALAAWLGFARAGGAQPDPEDESPARREDAAALRELRLILHELVAEGKRRLPFFGGLDLRAANMRRDAGGQLKLIDPIFVAGRDMIAALHRDPGAVARRIPPADLRAWLQIACFEHAEHDSGFQALRAIVLALDRA